MIGQEYRGQFCIGNRRHKADKLLEINSKMGMHAEDLVDEDLKPRWKDGAAKAELDWSLELLDEIADLAAVHQSKHTLNLAMWRKLRDRMEKDDHQGPTQIRPKEVRAARKEMEHPSWRWQIPGPLPIGIPVFNMSPRPYSSPISSTMTFVEMSGCVSEGLGRLGGDVRQLPE